MRNNGVNDKRCVPVCSLFVDAFADILCQDQLDGRRAHDVLRGRAQGTRARSGPPRAWAPRRRRAGRVVGAALMTKNGMFVAWSSFHSTTRLDYFTFCGADRTFAYCFCSTKGATRTLAGSFLDFTVDVMDRLYS